VSRYTQLLTIIHIGAFALLLSACGSQNDATDFESVNEYLIKLSDTLNKNLPDMADDNTILERTSGANRVFSYYYTLLNYSAGEVDTDAFIDHMKPALLQGTCTSEFLASLVRRDVTVQYFYADKDRNDFATIIISPAECKDTH